MLLGLAVDDVLEVADAAGEILAVPRPVLHLGAELPGPQRLHGLQHEAERKHDVDADDGTFDLPLDGRQLGTEAGLGGRNYQRGIQATHQDEREPRLAVAEIEEVVALVERVVQRAIELRRRKRAVVVELLTLLTKKSVVLGNDAHRRRRRVHARGYRHAANSAALDGGHIVQNATLHSA